MLLKHITSILGKGLHLLIKLDAKRIRAGAWRRMTKHRETGGKITRTRDKDTVTQW